MRLPWKKAPPVPVLYPLSAGSDTYRVPSEGTPGRWYTVNLRHQTCSCPSFTYRNTCKHLRRFSDSIQAFRKGALL